MVAGFKPFGIRQYLIPALTSMTLSMIALILLAQVRRRPYFYGVLLNLHSPEDDLGRRNMIVRTFVTLGATRLTGKQREIISRVRAVRAIEPTGAKK